MPRGKKRTTQSGADAQKVRSVPGQRYGEGVAQQAMQRAMPAPALREEPVAAAPTTAPTAPAPAAMPVDPTAALAQAPIGLLSATQLPGQPVTAGLSTGPGAGPGALGMLRATTPLSRMLRQLSDRSGDPIFRDLADRAGL